jgi:hypothetical protein
LNLTPGGRTETPVRFMLPTQDLQLLVRLQVGAMLFAPMHIDTVVIDLKAGTLSIVRRALVSAAIEIRKLELGTWAAGTHPNANFDQQASQPSGAQTRGQ